MFYAGVLVFGFIFAFLDAYGIGANDVANSFAATVASGTLTYKQAVGIAFFTEFLGALFLGSGVAGTIQKKIIDVDSFNDNPAELMLGMVCALFGSSMWVLSATRFGLPVSSTHSIVGAIIGIGIAAHGPSSVDWGTWDSGVVSIVLSWIIAPLLSGFIAFLLYSITKLLVLRDPATSLSRAYITFPFYLAATVTVIAFFMIYDGAPGLKLDTLSTPVTVGVIGGICALTLIGGYLILVPRIKKIMEKEEHVKLIEEESSGLNLGYDTTEKSELAPNGPNSRLSNVESWTQSGEKEEEATTVMGKMKKFFTYGLSQDVTSTRGDEELEKIRNRAVQHGDKTERVYSILQIMTSCFASFAHGSNDVANAVGPFTTIWYIAENASVNKGDMDVPIWILVYGATALDLGLLTYGYHIMRSLGTKITLISPVRGFIMGLATTFTVLTASKLGLPVSTTHCITGATAGVGLSDGDVGAVNWKHLMIVFFGWIATVPMAALTSGCLFAILAYSPKH